MIDLPAQVNFRFLRVLTYISPRIDKRAGGGAASSGLAAGCRDLPAGNSMLCGELAMTDEMWYQAAFERGIERLGADFRDGMARWLPTFAWQ